MVYNIQELWGLIQLILKLKAFKYLSNKFQGMSVTTWRSNTDGEGGTTYTYPLSSSHFLAKNRFPLHCSINIYWYPWWDPKTVSFTYIFSRHTCILTHLHLIYMPVWKGGGWPSSSFFIQFSSSAFDEFESTLSLIEFIWPYICQYQSHINGGSGKGNLVDQKTLE